MREELEAYRLHGKLPVIKRRTDRALETIRDWRARCQKPYIAWSTGKDSTLCLRLALRVDPKIQVVYFDADSCLPDSEKFIERLVPEWNLNFRRVKTRPILDVLAQYGLTYPGIEYQTMKATVYEPIKSLRAEGYDGVIVGVRAEESRGRKIAASALGSMFRAKSSGMLTCWPLAQWASRDVWGATINGELPYNTAYDKTRFAEFEEMRVSYWAGETNRTYGRYVWLRYYYPDLYRRLAERCPDLAAFV